MAPTTPLTALAMSSWAPPRERVAPPTLAEIDRRIEERVAAEHELMIEVLGELLAQLKHDAEMRGPPGAVRPAGRRGSAR
jgi:hypothetical protein